MKTSDDPARTRRRFIALIAAAVVPLDTHGSSGSRGSGVQFAGTCRAAGRSSGVVRLTHDERKQSTRPGVPSWFW